VTLNVTASLTGDVVKAVRTTEKSSAVPYWAYYCPEKQKAVLFSSSCPVDSITHEPLHLA